MGLRQLESIRRSNIARAEWERDQAPVYCPHDGTPLRENKDGVRDCPMGNYTWRG